MTEALPQPDEWGYWVAPVDPETIVARVRHETERAIDEYSALPDGPEPCTDRESYFRMSVVIRLPELLFHQLMNGATGYRAHYSVNAELGERFNRRLVEEVAPIIMNATYLYEDRFDRRFCESSLLGPYTKLWFTTELTDPSAQERLLTFQEQLRVPRWVRYWQEKARPRKGLLAPAPSEPSVLLNGTFVNDGGGVYEQKPGRSTHLFDTGWT
jgi:hypothetical protein